MSRLTVDKVMKKETKGEILKIKRNKKGVEK